MIYFFMWLPDLEVVLCVIYRGSSSSQEMAAVVATQ